MGFTYEKLRRLELGKTDWVTFKLSNNNSYFSGQIGTNQIWPNENQPIFDEDENHIYIHLAGEQANQPSASALIDTALPFVEFLMNNLRRRTIQSGSHNKGKRKRARRLALFLFPFFFS